MEAKRPIRLKPRKSVPVPEASPVTRLPTPSPMKKITIMPTWLQRQDDNAIFL